VDDPPARAARHGKHVQRGNVALHAARTWLNVGAGATFVASGLSILALGQRR